MRGNIVVKCEGKPKKRLKNVRIAYRAELNQALITRGENDPTDVITLEGAVIDVLDIPKNPIMISGFQSDGKGKYDMVDIKITPLGS